MTIERWALNVLEALDRLGNALLLGDPKETISSRAARAREEGKPWGCVFCRLINPIARLIAGQRDHCTESIGI